MPSSTISARFLLLRLATGINGSLERHFWRWASVFLALIFACSIAKDLRLKLWNDELLTLYVAKQPDTAEIVKAIAEGCDGAPPLYAMMTHAILPLIRHDALAVRLPATIGFGCFLLCLLVFARRRLPAAHSLLASLLACNACLYYATEGRPYAVVLGCGAGALLCWQAAAEGRRRVLTIPLMAICLAAMIALHYYAVFFLAPLFLAEIVRTKASGRLDFMVLIAMAPALLVLALHYPLIAASKPFQAHFWSPASWRLAEFFYLDYFWPMLGICAAIAVLVTGILPSRPPLGSVSQAGMPLHEWVAVGALTLMPAVAVGVSKYTTHIFVERYTLWAVIGFALLTAAVLSRTMGSDAMVGVSLLVLVSAMLARQERASLRQRPTIRENEAIFDKLEALPAGSEPVVVPDPHVFLELTYYGEPDLRSRLIYPASTDLDVRYRGYDTDARTLIALRHRNEKGILDYDAVLANYSRFLLAGSPQTYMLWRLIGSGYRVTPITPADGQAMVFEIDAPTTKRTDVPQRMETERMH